MCPKVTKEGPRECKVQTCTQYHPKVCYGSLASPRVCLRRNCTYRHLPETKRAASRREEVESKKEEERIRKEEKKGGEEGGRVRGKRRRRKGERRRRKGERRKVPAQGGHKSNRARQIK